MDKRLAPRGTVVVRNFKERLRLDWSWQGKRFSLSVGLSDTPVNRKAAELKARQIELDIVSNNFDPTLAKYKPERQGGAIACTELFDRFIAYKGKRVESQTLIKYKSLANLLQQYFKQKTAIAIGEAEAQKFIDWLRERLEDITARERLVLLRACWNWGRDRHLVQENPWKDIKIKVAPKQMSRPFTSEEVKKILEAFRTNPQWQHYADYVEFIFSTGCRTGEAIALQWKHLNENCSVLWIGTSAAQGARKSTKTNKVRDLPLSSRLQQMLLNRRSINFNPDDIVFPSTEGKLIDPKNFCRRYWQPALASVAVPYRQPYTMRHTFISHALEKGMNPVNVASLTGHDVETLDTSANSESLVGFTFERLAPGARSVPGEER